MIDLRRRSIGSVALSCALLGVTSMGFARVGHAEDFEVRPWDEYRVILWLGGSADERKDDMPLFLRRLREMGVNTAMVHGDADAKSLLDDGFPYYVENIVNRGLCLKWNSSVTDWDSFVTAWRTPRDKGHLVRDYCLDDPAWREEAIGQMRRVATKNAANHPLAYDIRDEISTTFSANPFDYDFHPKALEGFRAWLRSQYADLAALNAEWETQFPTWAEVVPFTTDEIKNRIASGDALPRGTPDWGALSAATFDPAVARRTPTRWNLSPWCDFRTYMDVALARALGDLRHASHEVDPRTPVGIEGTQMPHAFGGYDLWRLSQVLDWVEPYDIGNAREIFGSFMPGKPVLTTVGEADPDRAKRRLWHLLLEGDRGCIVWWSEDCISKAPDRRLTAKARALAPVLREMTGPLARLFLRAERVYDPIAIHYSQPSIQVDWLVESCEDGSSWLRRFSSYEAAHNRMARDRDECLAALREEGFDPRFVSSEQVENGVLRTAGYVALLMPSSYALSAKEATALSIQRPRVLSSTAAGSFDEHGRLRAGPALVSGDSGSWAQRIRGLSGVVARPVTVTAGGREAHTAVRRFRLGSARLVAFERDVRWSTSESLEQQGGNEALETPIDLEARLAEPAHVYDLRARKYLGWTSTITFRLDPWQPSLFALLEENEPAETLIDTLQGRAR